MSAAVRHLNYRGDVTASLHVGLAMGPNTTGEMLYVVGWTYDVEVDRTKVGLSYILPAARAGT